MMTFLKLIAGLIAAIFVLFIILGIKSQKGAALGIVKGTLSECPSSPNCASSEADVQPEKQVAPLSASLAKAKAAIIKTGGTITSESDDYISATYMSGLFKFVDDVELRPDGDVVHIRSASRVGYSDRGVNKKRIEAIRAAL